MTTETLPEPSSWEAVGQNLLVWVVPWLAYYLGIFIRKRVFPGQDSPPLLDQFLLGIPICLVVVSPLLAVLEGAILSSSDGVPAYLFTIGVIMEHGMVLHETASRRIKMRIHETRGSG